MHLLDKPRSYNQWSVSVQCFSSCFSPEFNLTLAAMLSWSFHFVHVHCGNSLCAFLWTCHWFQRTILLWPTWEYQEKEHSAPAHSWLVAMVTCGFLLVPHPPYSPDLAPSDFHLFPNLKKALAGQRYTTDEEVGNWWRQLLEDQTTHSVADGRSVRTHRGTM